MLTLTDARVEIGARTLLRETSLMIRQGEKVALVGANGMGKTTLLRSIAGDLTLTAGSVSIPARTAFLRQETPRIEAGDGQTALEYLLDASPLTPMRRRLERLTGMMSASEGEELEAAIHEYGDLQERFAHGGGYELDATAERIAGGVGLDDEALLAPAAALSGGERRKLDLARLLLAGGELFILDEPTNHLDVAAKRWVMNFLGQTPATVLVVSHDLKLMDTSFDRVLALENAEIDSYRGTYSDFIRQRAENEAQRAHQARSLSREAARLEDTKKVFAKGNATHAAKRRALQRRIDALNVRMKDHAPAVRRRRLTVRFPEPVRSGDRVLDVTGLAKSFGENHVFSGVELTVRRGDMLLLVGINGAGKTTLLRCLAGREEPDAGSVRLGANVTAGYYAQEHEDIVAAASVLDNLRSRAPEASEGELRAVLGHFGLVGDVAAQDAGTLSGGEKTKLALARLMVARANLLLLDEPTNNLDPQSVEALLAALQNYEGTAVLVSHDAEFVSQLAPERVLLLPESRLGYFDEAVLELIPQR